jgi:anti-sigma regulatory factor (Ser/Thr protein kinase)
MSHVRLASVPHQRVCRGAAGGDMTQRWPLRSSLILGALPGAVPCARLHARQVLWEWRLDSIADTVELLVSELVTNGVKASREMENVPPVWLRLSSDRVRVRIEVWDGNPYPPLPKGLGEDRIPAVAEESGRGLFLVETLSQRWNWYMSREWSGKVVWCELPAIGDDALRTDTTERGGP